MPGVAIGWVQGGKLAWSRGLGVMSLADKKPVTADTIFQAASLSKQVTAYAVTLLRDQNKLDFDRTLVSYVDDLEDVRGRRGTIRHVLSHCSGFPNWRDEKGEKLVPSFEPGERFRYSGEGYVYLQRIIERVTGKSFAEAIDDMVFTPLQMKSTATQWMPEWEGRYALPHNRRAEPQTNWLKNAQKLHEFAASKPGRTVRQLRYEDSEAFAKSTDRPPLPNFYLPNAAASMLTSTNDYAKFLVAAAMQNTALRKPVVEIRAGKDWMLGWGPGWGVERFGGGREFLWQWGDNGGCKNIVLVEPARGEALFVFTNGDGGAKIYDRVVRHLTGLEHPALIWV